MMSSILADNTLGRVRAASMPRRVFAIVAAVAEDHGVNPYDLLTDDRRGFIMRARQAACAEVRAMPYMGAVPSYPMIGRWFDLHHTTVINACRAVAERSGELRTYRKHPHSYAQGALTRAVEAA